MANQTMFQTLCSETHLLNAWKDIKNRYNELYINTFEYNV